MNNAPCTVHYSEFIFVISTLTKNSKSVFSENCCEFTVLFIKPRKPSTSVICLTSVFISVVGHFQCLCAKDIVDNMKGERKKRKLK